MSNYYKRRDTAPRRDHTNCNDCVCSVVKNIVNVQDEADDDCSLSCGTFIQQLKGGGNETDTRHTTIPFMLYCGGACEPFIGNGVFQAPKGKRGTFFGCVETPVFRAKRFVKDSDCCVILELLLPVNEYCESKQPPIDTHNKVCSFFPGDDPVTDFQATGICLTVDLEKFIAITCLDPITPLPANEFLDTMMTPPKEY